MWVVAHGFVSWASSAGVLAWEIKCTYVDRGLPTFWMSRPVGVSGKWPCAWGDIANYVAIFNG